MFILVPVFTAALVSINGQTDPPKAEFTNLLVAANRFYGLKQYDQAILLATNASKLKDDDHRPWAIVGNCYLMQLKMKSASEAYAKAASINPKLKGLWYLKAYADRRRNAREESIEAARKAIEIDSNYAEAYLVMGESLAMGSKDTKGAIEALRTAVRIKPDLFEASSQLGMQLLAVDKREAETVFRAAMERDPKKMACRFQLGRLLVDQGRLVEAREIWNGRAEDEKNTFPKFIDVLERAERKKAAADNLEASPDSPDALLAMGFAQMEGEYYSHDGRQAKALAYFQKALKLKPDLERAQYGICKAYIEMASIDAKFNKNADDEIATLRKKNAKLADELVEYRKTFRSSICCFGDPVN